MLQQARGTNNNSKVDQINIYICVYKQAYIYFSLGGFLFQVYFHNFIPRLCVHLWKCLFQFLAIESGQQVSLIAGTEDTFRQSREISHGKFNQFNIFKQCELNILLQNFFGII